MYVRHITCNKLPSMYARILKFLADGLKVSQPTIRRWVRGKNLPHRAMRKSILKYLTNLLFKRIFRGFLTPRKKREPNQYLKCQICGSYFAAFNKRQRVCKRKYCIKTDRAKQYRAGLERKRLEANKASVSERDHTYLESEE